MKVDTLAALFVEVGKGLPCKYLMAHKEQMLFLGYKYKRYLQELHALLLLLDAMFPEHHAEDSRLEISIYDDLSDRSFAMASRWVRIMPLQALKPLLPAELLVSEDGFSYRDDALADASVILGNVLCKSTCTPIHRFVTGHDTNMQELSRECPTSLTTIAFSGKR